MNGERKRQIFFRCLATNPSESLEYPTYTECGRRGQKRWRMLLSPSLCRLMGYNFHPAVALEMIDPSAELED